MDPDAAVDETLETLERGANVALAIRAISAQMAAGEMRRELARQGADRQRWTGHAA